MTFIYPVVLTRHEDGSYTGEFPDLYMCRCEGPTLQDALDEWEDISKHMQMDLETFARQQGLQVGGMQQLLQELNREKYDYEAFLKKFAVMGEVMNKIERYFCDSEMRFKNE